MVEAEPGEPVEVGVDSIAADALGARLVTPAALHWALHGDTRSVLVEMGFLSNAADETALNRPAPTPVPPLPVAGAGRSWARRRPRG